MRRNHNEETNLDCLLPLFTAIFALPVSAEEADAEILISRTVEVQPDGSSIEILLYQSPVYTRGNSYSMSGSKVYNSTNAAGEVQWTFRVTGVFKVVEGSSVYCTSASHSYSIVNNNWNFVSGSSYKSGNKAIGNAEFNRKVLGIVVETDTCTVTLTCDANGNLS